MNEPRTKEGGVTFGDRVMVQGIGGVGKVVKVLPPHYEGDRRGRQFQIDYGLEPCRECRQPHRRVQWAYEMHTRACR